MKTTHLVASAFLLSCCASSVHGQSLDWTRTLGTNSDDQGFGVSADGLGALYMTGRTRGNLGGTHAGDWDAFLGKYDANGILQWTGQLGTSGRDESYGVSADRMGGVYITGFTEGSLEGTNAGDWDAFVSKYDRNGALQWTRQLGTSSPDQSYGVSADGMGNVYIAGVTEGSLEGSNAGNEDAFVSKYDTSGMLLWTRQLGAAGREASYGVSADRLGNVYITGRTTSNLGGTTAGSLDAFISKYDGSGTFKWTRQLGTSLLDESRAVSADGLGNVYITGLTFGSLAAINVGDDWDAFLSKYDANGTLQWTRQFGTNGRDQSFGVSTDGLGGVIMTGLTDGSLDGINSGNVDTFVSRYDASGDLQWTQLIRTNHADRSRAVSADGQGGVYIAGWIEGNLDGTVRLDRDAFVAKITFDLPKRGDFDRDGDVDTDDVDALVRAIAAGREDLAFDLSADGSINNADLSQWLVDAANANGFNDQLLLGDANLDGSVDASDLNHLALNWRAHVALWSAGDFTADGRVDSDDLNWLALNWRRSIPTAASQTTTIPEPTAINLTASMIAAVMCLRRRLV